MGRVLRHRVLPRYGGTLWGLTHPPVAPPARGFRRRCVRRGHAGGLFFVRLRGPPRGHRGRLAGVVLWWLWALGLGQYRVWWPVVLICAYLHGAVVHVTPPRLLRLGCWLLEYNVVLFQWALFFGDVFSPRRGARTRRAGLQLPLHVRPL